MAIEVTGNSIGEADLGLEGSQEGALALDAGESQGDGTGGDGNGGQETLPAGEEKGQYGGFQTPEELIAAYTEAQSKVDNLSTRVSDLDSLRGRQGSELGELRSQVSNLTGLIQEYQQKISQPATPSVSMDQLNKQLDEGDISLSEYISKRDSLLKDENQNFFKTEFQRFREEMDKEKYADTFIAQNPGYLDAFNTGKLKPDMDMGYPAEHAWDRHNLRTAQQEITTLKAQVKTLSEQAKKAGQLEGKILEQGSRGTDKVLDASRASFGQGSGTTTPRGPLTTNERISKAKEILKRIR